jgi:hypothetical protein
VLCEYRLLERSVSSRVLLQAMTSSCVSMAGLRQMGIGKMGQGRSAGAGAGRGVRWAPGLTLALVLVCLAPCMAKLPPKEAAEIL